LEIVRRIQTEFQRRTAPSSTSPPRRYLWTDAFAVCNDLELHRRTGDAPWLVAALDLVEQVHGTLGRHRPDDPRHGWISGLSEEEGREHPTRGGLRIGKELGERGPDEPFDERLEWERDGQYFHYLTKWMHALGRVAAVTGDDGHLRWAVELALAAYRGFVRRPPGASRPHLCWKMSIDLSRPLVATMGAHDPLDGLLTLKELAVLSRTAGPVAEAAALDEPRAELRAMCEGREWVTIDPLGLGGLLADAHRLGQLLVAEPREEAGLLPALLDGGLTGLSALVRTSVLAGPAAERLPFRELGLAIGLHAVPRLAEILEQLPQRDLAASSSRALDGLLRFLPLAGAVEEFWLEPAHQATAAWLEHLDINSVMLATSLLPDGFLCVGLGRRARFLPPYDPRP